MYSSLVPEKVVYSKNEYDLEDLFNQLISELNFQKEVHLHTLSLLDENSKQGYIENYQKNIIYDFFKHNKVVCENFKNEFKTILTESIETLSQQIESFNNFFVSSLMFDCGLISEQWWNPLDYAKKAYNAVKGVTSKAWNTTKNAASTVYNKVKQAVNYVKEKGIGTVFEGLRNALMSGVGTAIQIALSFTGVGAIANEIAWGIMTLYDAYQYFVNKVSGSLSNLIIDLVCLLTAGSLGKVLKGFVGKAYTSIQQFFTAFINSGGGKYIKPVLNKLKNGASSVSSFLSSSSEFMKTKMGIGWASNLINKVVEFFKGIAEKIGTFIGSKTAGTVLRAGITLSNKFEAAALTQLAQKSEQEIAKIVGDTVTKSQIQAAGKYSTEYLKEKPTKEALTIIDQKFGTKMGDAYSLYLGATKSSKHTSKLSSGAYKATDYGTDVLRGDFDPITKASNLSQKVSTSAQNIAGDNSSATTQKV